MTAREFRAFVRSGYTTPEQYARSALAKPKYGNRRTVVDGITFGSKGEADLYLRLKAEAEETGATIFCQVTFPLLAADSRTNRRPRTWRADFVMRTGDAFSVHEFKGYRTRDFPFRLSAFRRTYPGVPVTVWEKRSGSLVPSMAREG